MKIFKRTIKILLLVIAAAILIVAAYVIYVVATYDRIADKTEIKVMNDGKADGLVSSELIAGKPYSAFTFNLGFGAYDHDFSFFMDEGSMADGTETVGSESRAASKAAVKENTEACIETAFGDDPDILLFQEVDVKADRSYKVDQRSMLTQRGGEDYFWTFASNFHSAYLFYPVTKPIGKISESGLLTMSKFGIDSAERRSYPVSDAFPTKFFDLDRCFTVNTLPVGGTDAASRGGNLVLINTHMSAYDKGGTIRREQMELLGKVITEEYEKGNWVIVGGDFNHAIGGSETKFKNEMEVPPWVETFAEDQLPEHFRMVIADNAGAVATDRDTSIPYQKGVNYEVTLDGFIVSDNVEASSKNIDADYVGSDHNPVRLDFVLKGAGASDE